MTTKLALQKKFKEILQKDEENRHIQENTK
jgi:hypothetical protein